MPVELAFIGSIYLCPTRLTLSVRVNPTAKIGELTLENDFLRNDATGRGLNWLKNKAECLGAPMQIFDCPLTVSGGVQSPPPAFEP